MPLAGPLAPRPRPRAVGWPSPVPLARPQGKNLTCVSDEDRLLQGDVGHGGTGLAHPDLGRLSLVPHLPQLGVLKVGSHMSLPVAGGPELLVAVRASKGPDS